MPSCTWPLSPLPAIDFSQASVVAPFFWHFRIVAYRSTLLINLDLCRGTSRQWHFRWTRSSRYKELNPAFYRGCCRRATQRKRPHRRRLRPPTTCVNKLISLAITHHARCVPQRLPQQLASVLARTELTDQLSGFRWFRMARVLHIDHLDHIVAPSVYIFQPCRRARFARDQLSGFRWFRMARASHRSPRSQCRAYGRGLVAWGSVVGLD